MAEYNLGTAHGVVEISSNTAGLASAGRDLDAIKAKGESTHASLQKLGTGMLVAGGIIAAGLGIAVKTASDFESKLSAISAVSGATADEMQKIRDKALQLGKDTKYSAGEAASAMEELSKAGISTTNILGGAADATVALAAAGEVDLPFAATVASNAMNQFNLSAADMVGVVDSIAGAANASAIDVSDFGMSLSQVGAVANLAGLSFGDTAIAIAEMGNAGIKGSDAGTSLKSMLMRLQPQTTAQAEEMRKLGIITADGSNKFYDQAGNLKSLRGIQDILGKSLEGMSKQQKQATLQTIFGSDAIRAAAIFSNEGAKGYDKMNEAIGKTSAAEIAAKRMDNFAGSLEQLKGSAETLGIQIGTVLMPILRNIIDRVRGIVDIFIGMNDTVKTVMVVIAMLVGSLLLLGGGLIKAHQFFGNFMDALRAGRAVMTTVIERIQSMAVSIRAQIVQIRAAATAQMQAAAQSGFFATAATLAATGVRTLALAIRTVITTLGPIGLAFGAAAAAAAFFTGKSDDGMESTQAWTQALYDQNGALAANARALIAKGVAENSAFANLKQFGLTYGQVSAALAGDAKMMDYVTKKFNAAIAAGAGDAAANVQNWNFQTTSALDLRNAAIAALAALNDTNGAIGEAGVIAANTAAGLAGMDKIMGKVPKTTVDATRAYNNVSDAVKKHLETLKTAASASEQRLSEWVQRQKNKLDAAMARWNSYRDTVMSALTGNVKIGDAWGKTQDQAKAAKDAAKELADAKAVLAQEEANAATDAARNAAKNRVEAEIKAEADARQFASIADPVDRAKAIAAAQLDATIKANEEARKAAVESQYASDPLASAKAAVAAAEVAAASASAAAQTFDQNFAAQVADSTLFGTLSAQRLGLPLFTLALGLLDGFDDGPRG